MNSRTTRLLIILNTVLLAAIAFAAFTPNAVAQQRNRGQYIMLGGTAQGNSKGILYITDEMNLEVIAVQWDDNQRALNGLGYRNIAADAAASNRTGGR
ncbi:MAG: hypothetical protein O2800_01390 [Planctomycetota bacterium]|nr:hypothetical protein [Planctomycetota bacterium]